MIEITGLNKRYGDRVLFSDFNLTINDHEFVAISGPSGSGKTTLLNMIGGLEAPDSGSMVVCGYDVSSKGRKVKYYRDIVGFLFQNYALIDGQTVSYNLRLVKRGRISDETIEAALKEVGLKDVINKKVYTLSGGEQQRVALARLILKDCSVILADEPTGSLDVENENKVLEILRNLNKSGKTIVVVSHSERVIREADRVIYIT